jgi:hypothetical protein
MKVKLAIASILLVCGFAFPASAQVNTSFFGCGNSCFGRVSNPTTIPPKKQVQKPRTKQVRR